MLKAVLGFLGEDAKPEAAGIRLYTVTPCPCGILYHAGYPLPIPCRKRKDAPHIKPYTLF